MREEKIELLRRVVRDTTLKNIITAFRPPDFVVHYYLETVFTKPIQWISSGWSTGFEAVKGFMRPLNVEDMLKELPFAVGNIPHWFEHITDAYRSLWALGLIDDHTYEYVNCIFNIFNEALSELGLTKTLSKYTIERLMERVRRSYEKLISKS